MGTAQLKAPASCGGSRKRWNHKDEFPGDCRDLIDQLLALPSKPRLWLCAPTPMVQETPGLKGSRIKDLKERSPRLQELIAVIKAIALEKKIGFIDLNTPLADKLQCFTDGVHMNKHGYRLVAELVKEKLKP